MPALGISYLIRPMVQGRRIRPIREEPCLGPGTARLQSLLSARNLVADTHPMPSERIEDASVELTRYQLTSQGVV